MACAEHLKSVSSGTCAKCQKMPEKTMPSFNVEFSFYGDDGKGKIYILHNGLWIRQ